MVTGSFVCGCGRTFGRSSDLTRHKKYCNDRPTPPKQSELSRTLLLPSDRPLKVVQVCICLHGVTWYTLTRTTHTHYMYTHLLTRGQVSRKNIM